MSKIKIFKYLKYLKKIREKRDFPIVVNYDITSKCNLNCEHCYWRKTYNSSIELTDDEWEKIFIEHKKRGAITAFLTGGEPTLRLNVIKMADSIFDGLGIVSNGTIKIPEYIQRAIYVSIDGPKEIHNKIRRKDVFDTVISNIQDDKRVVITPTLSTTNYKYIDDLIDITRKTNVRGITFSTYVSHKESGDPLLLEGEKLDWTLKKLKEVLRKNKDIVLLSSYMIKLFKNKKHTKHCYLKTGNCISYDANMNKKEPCVFGKGVNCKTCGCIVPIFGYAMQKGNIRAWRIYDKMFPIKYFKNLDKSKLLVDV